MSELKHLNIKIFGVVQGVSFRYYTLQKADELELKGFVRNQPDGSVYIEVEGNDENLEKFVEWCNEGPEFARIEKVIVNGDKLRNFESFEIER